MYSFSTIEKYLEDLKQGHISCETITQQYLHHIKTKAHLNIFITIFEDSALEKAKELDVIIKTGLPLLPLHGVIIAIKDVICYKGHKTTAASKVLQNFTSVYNSNAVEKLLAAGAIIIGSTNCDEFAMGSTNENSYFGKTLNAANTNCVPGGSSGGSAVAMQTNCCMISLGSDTGGSVRQPADFCGVVGMKPSYGRISRHGLIAYASSFDQIGIFSNHIADTAKILEIIAGPDNFDATAIQENWKYNNEVSDLKFGYFKNAIENERVDSEIKQKLSELVNEIKSNFNTEELYLEWLEYIVPTYYVLTTAEASSNLGRYDGVRYGHRTEEKVESIEDLITLSRSESFGYEVQKRIMLGTFVLSAGYFDAYFGKAQKVRQLLIEKCEKYFENCDVIILPNSPTTAFEFGQGAKDPLSMYLADIFTVYANLVGIPSISVPLYTHSNGLPFGVQIIAPFGKENEMFAAAIMIKEKFNKV